VAYYLFQCAYSAEAWASQIKNPTDRLALVRPVAEAVGGNFREAWLSFGEYDVVGIIEAPNNVSAAAFAMAAGAAGHLKAVKTTPLMTIEEGIEAMGRAGSVLYPTPGS
jgi:uncharacterized protein with GYD domain